GFSQIPIKDARSDFISKYRFYCGPTYVDFPARVVRCPADRCRTNLRLKDWRHRLRFVLQSALHPAELRSIERGHLDHGNTDVTLVVNQLTAQRISETGDGMLGCTIGRLQRDAAISER